MMSAKQLIAGCAAISLLLSGCAAGKPESAANQSPAPAAKAEEPKKPVTLIWYQHVLIPDDLFKTLIADPVKKKFPYITIEQHKKQDPDPAKDIDRLVAAGKIPDIVYTSSWHVGFFQNADIPQDLNALIKKSNYDLTKFEPKAVEAIKSYGKNGEMYAIPYTLNYAALFYNKDIFDKFAVPYPKEGLTWDDVIDLSRKVSRLENGVQYQGFNPLQNEVVSEPLSPGYFAPGTTKPALLTDDWKKAFTLYDTFSKIPGNEVVGWNQGKDAFAKTQTLAMLPVNIDYISELDDMRKQGTNINWGVTSYPNYKEKPGIARATDVHNLLLAKTSKQQEVAFEVINFLTEKEQQMIAVQNGRPSSYKDPKMKEAFGSNIESLKGRNVQAVFRNGPATPAPFSIYNDAVKKELSAAATRVVQNKQDVNTALREAEEKAAKAIEALGGK